jgi:hypothetical protein
MRSIYFFHDKACHEEISALSNVSIYSFLAVVAALLIHYRMHPYVINQRTEVRYFLFSGISFVHHQLWTLLMIVVYLSVHVCRNRT